MNARNSRIVLSSLTLIFLLCTVSGVLAANPAPTYKDSATGMEFVLVPGDCYQMGNKLEGGSYTEYPVHEVCVDSFYIGKTEVTQGQWMKLMKENPSSFKLGDNYPVESLTRAEATSFMQKMAKGSGKAYRLPTEAEWEFACRSGGNDENFCGGDDAEEVAWFENNSEKIAHPVAQKKPNGLGLYDMSGSVWELCSDIFARDYYENSPKNNPKGPEKGFHMMKRGGSWAISDNFITSTARGRSALKESHYLTGFRVVFPAKP